MHGPVNVKTQENLTIFCCTLVCTAHNIFLVRLYKYCDTLHFIIKKKKKMHSCVIRLPHTHTHIS